MTYPGLPASLPSVLVAHHSVRTRVEVLTTGMQSTGQQLTAALLDGQVNVDADAEVTRSLTVSFLDPDRQLTFDSDSPADGALYADRMLRVWYGVRAPGGAWIEVPVFTGPIVKFLRDGAMVTAECQGKELLAMGSAWRTKTYKKNSFKVDVIEAVMREEGERHFALLDSKARLPGDRTITPEANPWTFASDLAKSMGMQLYYDGWGRLRLRSAPQRPVWTFASGDGGSIMTAPRITFETDQVRNAVRVVGKKPKGAKVKVQGRAVAPANHPLSPARLGRNGQPRYIGEFIEDSSIGSNKECDRVAEARLKSLLMQLVSVEFDALTVPHLDAGDPVSVKTDDFAMTTRLGKFTIPLKGSSLMSVGYNRRVSRPTGGKGRRSVTTVKKLQKGTKR